MHCITKTPPNEQCLLQRKRIQVEENTKFLDSLLSLGQIRVYFSVYFMVYPIIFKEIDAPRVSGPA